MNQAIQANAKGDFSTVSSLLTRVLTIRPGFIPALLGLGTLAGYAGRTDEAVSRMLEVVSLDADNFEALKWLGALLQDRGQLITALEYGERAAESVQEIPKH